MAEGQLSRPHPRFSCLVRQLVTLIVLILTGCRPAVTISLAPTGQGAAASMPTRASTASATVEVTATAPAVSAAPTLSTTPAASPTPTPLTCWGEGGRFETGRIETDLLRQPLDFRVYLPPCYAAQPERRYPVLYLIHGQSSSDDQWDRLGADESADRLIAAGELPPFLIVMPRDRRWDQPTEDLFGRAVAELLVPQIDATYRTLPDRAQRAVGGLSRGAGWAVHLGISRWDLFGALGAHSLALFHTDARQMRTWLEAIPPGSFPRIYLDLGDRDRPEITRAAVWFEGLLNEKDLPHEWRLYPGYHEEAYWSAHVEEYLRWYAGPWKE